MKRRFVFALALVLLAIIAFGCAAACSESLGSTPTTSLSAQAQYILDAGQFSEKVEFSDSYRFTVYTNMALRWVYRSDIAVHPTVNEPGGMMEATYGPSMIIMRVIDGCGAQWVREAADSRMEDLIQRWQGHEEWLRTFYSDEEFEEEVIPRMLYTSASHEEFMRYHAGDYFERQFRFLDFIFNVEDIAFLPVEYEAAGRIFQGLQIDAEVPGFRNLGFTYLYTQIDDGMAIVISISTSINWARWAASRHMARITDF